MKISGKAVKKFFYKAGAWVGIQAVIMLSCFFMIMLITLGAILGIQSLFGKVAFLAAFQDNTNPTALLIFIIWLTFSKRFMSRFWDKTSETCWVLYKNFIDSGNKA